MARLRTHRPTLLDLNLSIGKRVRLHNLMYSHGPGNGTLLLLPVDQGLEHGPRDFFANPGSKDPEFQLRLAKEANFSGVVLNIGIAEKYLGKYAGSVPLVLKLNGRTEIPSDEHPFAPCHATVEDAVRLGADAVGYILYVGSILQAQDATQFREVRQAADRYGMPIIVWAYPRGHAVNEKGGQNGLYALDYAARAAMELGADVIKIDLPKIDTKSNAKSPKPYNSLQVSRNEAVRMIVESAGRSLLICSGGEIEDEESIIAKARIAMESGFTGLIFARNIWQRSFGDALKLSSRLHDILREHGA